MASFGDDSPTTNRRIPRPVVLRESAGIYGHNNCLGCIDRLQQLLDPLGCGAKRRLKPTITRGRRSVGIERHTASSSMSSSSDMAKAFYEGMLSSL